MGVKRSLIMWSVVAALLMAMARPLNAETPPIPESKGECSVLSGIMVGIGLVLGMPGEVLANAENKTFNRCLAGEQAQIVQAIKGMVAMLHDYQKVRERCAFTVGRDSIKGSLISSSATQKAMEECVALSWQK